MTKPLSPRQAAKAAGEKTYHGSPCKKCSGTERRTDNGVCIPCHFANGKNWRAANLDRVRANERQRRANNIEDYRAKDRALYAANREHYRQYARLAQKRYRAAHPEKFRERDRERYAANPEPWIRRARVYGPIWYKQNPDKARAKDARYRSRGKTATPQWLKSSGQDALIDRLYANTPLGMEVDHDIPIAGCRICKAVGLHVLANLQYIPRLLNKSKGNKCMTCFHKSTIP